MNIKIKMNKQIFQEIWMDLYKNGVEILDSCKKISKIIIFSIYY